MKFTLNKFVAAIAVTGAAFAMTACGGGGSDTVFSASDIPAVTVNAANTATAKAIATALINTPAITLPALASTGTAGAIAAGTTLKFETATSTAAGVLSGFTLTPPTGAAMTGNLVVGSCKFVIVTPVAQAGQEFVFDPCSFDLNTAGKTATGSVTSVPVVLNFGTTPVSTTVSGVTLTTNGSGGVSVSVGGTTVGTATLATGATGSSN